MSYVIYLFKNTFAALNMIILTLWRVWSGHTLA